jgi:hypothetical protein
MHLFVVYLGRAAGAYCRKNYVGSKRDTFARYPQPTTSGLLRRRAVATNSNFGLEAQRRARGSGGDSPTAQQAAFKYD